MSLLGELEAAISDNLQQPAAPATPRPTTPRRYGNAKTPRQRTTITRQPSQLGRRVTAPPCYNRRVPVEKPLKGSLVLLKWKLLATPQLQQGSTLAWTRPATHQAGVWRSSACRW